MQRPLVLLYPLLAVGAVLTFRTDLVGYVTALCLAGYAMHFGHGYLTAVIIASNINSYDWLVRAAE